jgi:serine/threonine-protein kinase
VLGTPAYMAPETARVGHADERSDVYAVGIIFYEMLTGFVPFDGPDAVDIMIKHVETPVPPPRDVSPEAEITVEAERAIFKALEKDPDLRYQTMEEFNADLQRCYGSVRFRRAVQVLPPGVNVASLRRPIRLTNVKKRPAASPGADGAPTDPSAAPASETPAPAAAPLLLTRRKSGRHRTLPFVPAFGATGQPEGPAAVDAERPDGAPRPSGDEEK